MKLLFYKIDKEWERMVYGLDDRFTMRGSGMALRAFYSDSYIYDMVRINHEMRRRLESA